MNPINYDAELYRECDREDERRARNDAFPLATIRCAVCKRVRGDVKDGTCAECGGCK